MAVIGGIEIGTLAWCSTVIEHHSLSTPEGWVGAIHRFPGFRMVSASELILERNRRELQHPEWRPQWAPGWGVYEQECAR